MADEFYNKMKTVVNSFHLPGTAFSVEKRADGSCGEICFFAINDAFKKSYYELFVHNHSDEEIDYETFHTLIEGKPYTTHIPKEPNFEDICFRAAWKGEQIHTYVDTRKMYGFWTEDMLLPVECPESETVSYCIFLYTLNKDLDTGKFAAVSPDVSAYVLKTCVELRNETEFYASMNVVTRDLRVYADAFAACIMSVDREQKTFEIIAEDIKEDTGFTIKDIFSRVPFSIISSWEIALAETNCIIIKDQNDMDVIAQKAPEWVKTLRDNYVTTLALVPLIHQGEIIGYLYLAGFPVDKTVKIKEAIELVAFFLTSEMANHVFMEKLEYLSNVDVLTGVFNRNCMNVNVDELSLKLEINPRPFSVAFCDLNGLKIVNDTKGHSAGDKLLIDAAFLLKEVFKGDQIYRAGGDEFTIISLDDSKEEFEEKIRLLREKANDPDWLNFAIGYYHDDKGISLRYAMQYADERMYEDKKAFYAEHPDKKR